MTPGGGPLKGMIPGGGPEGPKGMKLGGITGWEERLAWLLWTPGGSPA